MNASPVVIWRPRRLVLIAWCEACAQAMPTDHICPDSTTAPAATGAATEHRMEHS